MFKIVDFLSVSKEKNKKYNYLFQIQTQIFNNKSEKMKIDILRRIGLCEIQVIVFPELFHSQYNPAPPNKLRRYIST